LTLLYPNVAERPRCLASLKESAKKRTVEITNLNGGWRVADPRRRTDIN